MSDKNKAFKISYLNICIFYMSPLPDTKSPKTVPWPLPWPAHAS